MKKNILDIILSKLEGNKMVELLLDFTNTYKSYSSYGIERREAECNKVQLKGMVRPILENDLFAGRLIENPIGFKEQSDNGSLGYYLNLQAIEELSCTPDLTNKNRNYLNELVEFWRIENTEAKTKKAYSAEMKEVLPSDNYFGESGIAFTLWRMSGVQYDYKKLIKLGIPGLKEEVSKYNKLVKEGSKANQFYTSILIALDTFCELCLQYSQKALLQSYLAKTDERKNELKIMSSVLENITHSKPTTFREGLQLMYLYNIINGTRNYGRMDDSLGDLFCNDIENGIINDEEAIRLLSSIWQLMSDRNYRYDTRLIIGGSGRHNENNADKLALIIMETSNRLRDIVPQIALRFNNKQNPELYAKALDIIGSGYTFPMLYNDEVNIPAVQNAFEVSYNEAIHAVQYGCGEYVLNHRSVGTPSAVINLLQALLVTINMGTNPATGKNMGMPKDRYKKYNNFNLFDDLLKAFKEQLEYHIEQLALHEKLEYDYAGKDNPHLYTSLLMDDCLKRGKAIYSGGVRYLGGTLESYGNSNAADSLTAIRELVFNKKVFTLKGLNEILKSNFEGFEKERKMMLDCPKYGNDNNIADSMFIDIHEHVCNFTKSQKYNSGLHSYLIVNINNDANTVIGAYTSASPDGRKENTYMNPGNNPVGGADKNGITALLNSLVKPNVAIHAGAVQNIKFSKEMFSKHRNELELLLKTYFKMGGAQAMLTVISKGDLEEAVIHPEKYQNLIVRVGGFSERFVNLPPDTQQEVLSRTMY